MEDKKVSSSWTFNKETLKAHIEKVLDFQNKFVGKPGYNPFLWISKNIQPLINRLETAKETTRELHDAIMKLPLSEEPKVTTVEPKVETKKQEIKPTGLNIPEKK